jgi:hypothetical protein
MITLYNQEGPIVIDLNTKELKDLQERNKQRVEEFKQKMGRSYLLHPANMKKRLDKPR